MPIRRTTNVESIVREIQRVDDLPVAHRHNQPTARPELLEPRTRPYFIRAAEIHREICRERITLAAVGGTGVGAAGPRVRPHVRVGAVLLSVYKRGGRVAGLVAGREAKVPHSSSGLATGRVLCEGQRHIRTAGPRQFEAVVGEDVGLNKRVIERGVSGGGREEGEQENSDCELHVFEA